MFAMIYTQQFLVFQAPVVMLQWILGSEVVVLFTICRTILATARLVLATLTNSVSQEITYSFADRNLQKMLKIFHYSEKVVFGLIPVANLGAFLLSPILLKIWLHKPFLFEPYTYGLMALISGAMSMREHKVFFQYSTNMHQRLSMIMFFSNLSMVCISIPLTLKFGLYGFMFTWLVSELAQMGLIYHENKKLFHNDPSISIVPVFKLGLVMLVSLPICSALIHYALQRSLAMVGAAAVCGLAMLTVESYFVFGLKGVWNEFQRRRLGKVVTGAPAA
jgi:O-antigen/teichoic acid export membrane protein